MITASSSTADDRFVRHRSFEGPADGARLAVLARRSRTQIQARLAEPERPVLLDTDLVSKLMRGSLDPARSGLRAYDWCVSYITVRELAKGAEMARWNLRRWTDLADWLGHVVILPVDLRVAYLS